MSSPEDRHDAFVDYTVAKLERPDMVERFKGLKVATEHMLGPRPEGRPLEVLDIGCGMGIQALLWAESGYRVTGMDIDGALLEVGRERAREAGLDLELREGSATDAPFEDRSFDVCLCIELLEHVEAWEKVLDEVTRVVRPGGTLLLTTTNSLCPKQSEFNLPIYSWWPAAAKRWAVNAARTNRPALANFTDFPAVNWFTPYELAGELDARGFDTGDRLDAMRLDGRPSWMAAAIRTARAVPPLRFAYYLAVEGSLLFARRRGD